MKKLLPILILASLLSGCLETDKQCYDDIDSKIEDKISELKNLIKRIQDETVSQETFTNSTSQSVFKTIGEAKKAGHSYALKVVSLLGLQFQFRDMMELNDYDAACNRMFDGSRIVKK